MKIEINKTAEDSERAVSPVIGVILMVAITVILAAVIGAFVLGIGGDQEQTPQATLSISGDTPTDQAIEIDHRGGETLDPDEITVRVSAENDEVEVELADTLSTGESLSADGIGEDGGTATENTRVEVTVIHNPSDSIVRESTIRMEADEDDLDESADFD